MLKQVLAIVTVWGLLAPGAAPASARGQEKQKPGTVEKILDIPAGSVIEVQTVNKQKIRGKLGEAGEDGFALQTVRNDRLETQKLSFRDVKSVKLIATKDGRVKGAGHTVGWVIVGGLAALGVLAVVGLALAANGC
jgi:hypothetical protein